MRSVRRNPSHEVAAFARDLAEGRITTVSVERRLRQLRDELDDAIYFKRPQDQVDALRLQVLDIEAVLSGAATAPEGPVARRERLEQEAFRRASEVERLANQVADMDREIAWRDMDLHEAVRMRDPEHEIQAQRRALAELQARRVAVALDLQQAQSGLDAMAAAARSELAAVAPTARPVEVVSQRRTYDGRPLDADSAREIDGLLAQSRAGRFSVGALQDLFENAQRQYATAQLRGDQESMSAVGHKLMVLDEVLHEIRKESRRRKNPGGRRSRYVSGVERDLAAGKISMSDIARRVSSYRRLLEETIESDPEARDRIAMLSEQIAALERILRHRRSA